MSPSDRSYTQEHEWIIVEDAGARRALVGITDYAQSELGDIVYFELPKVGDTLTHLGKMGEVESVKAVSDLFSPVSGEVTELNDRLQDSPELVNDSPYGDGWMIRVSVDDSAGLDRLMSSDEYDAFLAAQE